MLFLLKPMGLTVSSPRAEKPQLVLTSLTMETFLFPHWKTGQLISLSIMQVVEGEGWKGALETSRAEPMRNVTIHTKALPARVPLSVRCGRKPNRDCLQAQPGFLLLLLAATLSLASPSSCTSGVLRSRELEASQPVWQRHLLMWCSFSYQR